jgi:hypothetical protein
LVRTLARCRSCGIPGTLAENMDWLPGGMIILKRMNGIRLIMLDAWTLKALYDEITAKIEPEIFYLREKGATRYIVGRLLSGTTGKISRYDEVKSKIMEVVENLAILTGMGRIELERYTPQTVALLIRKPLNLNLVTAAIAGVLEEIDKCFYEYIHSDIGESDYRLTLNVSNGGEYDRDSYDWLSDKPAEIRDVRVLGCCEYCGMPTALRDFEWDELRGIVGTGVAGRRVGLLPYYSFMAIKMMANELDADKSSRFIEETVYDVTIRQLESGIVDAYGGANTSLTSRGDGPNDNTWDVLHVRGWGVIDEAWIGTQEWRISVVNPIDVSLVAGWLRALYTFAMGKEPRLGVAQNAFGAQYVME